MLQEIDQPEPQGHPVAIMAEIFEPKAQPDLAALKAHVLRPEPDEPEPDPWLRELVSDSDGSWRDGDSQFPLRTAH